MYEWQKKMCSLYEINFFKQLTRNFMPITQKKYCFKHCIVHLRY